MMQGALRLELAVLWSDLLLRRDGVSLLDACTGHLKSCYLHRFKTIEGHWKVLLWHGGVFPVTRCIVTHIIILKYLDTIGVIAGVLL